MLVRINPKILNSFVYEVSERCSNMKFKYRNRQFWCRGCYVDIVGKNKIAIKKYIENKLSEDEQLIVDKIDPFTGSQK